MWFKLAGADFSKNNLGTMSSISSSYLIDYTGLTGMSGSPSSVSYAGSDAGTSKSVTVTVTITSGYTFKNGSTISASGGKTGTVFTADKDYTGGQTLTFSMAITANTKLSGTAEATGGSSSGGNPPSGGEPDTPVNPPSGATALTLANYPTTKGVATSGTGVWSATTTALLRRTAFVPVEGYSQIKLTHNADTYKYNLVFYNYNYTNSSQLAGSSTSQADGYISDLNGWQTTSPFTLTLPNGTKSIAIGVAMVSSDAENTASTLADNFSSINLIDEQGNKTALSLSNYNTHTGICVTGTGVWRTSGATDHLRRSAFVNVEGYAQIEFVFNASAYKLNVVSYSKNITQPSDITTISGIPASKDAYISDLGGWQETSPFTKEIPADAKCVLIGVARVDGSENTASTLADEFTSIELS